MSDVQLPAQQKIELWEVYWSPEGRCIATVSAKTAREAIHKAPYPYRKYLGEMYAVLKETLNG